MTRTRIPVVRAGLAVALVAALVGGFMAVRSTEAAGRTHIVGYFDNSNGLFVGDQVRILGVAVGRIDRIEPEPHRAKIHFWVDRRYPVPADANAVILSPSLVTARAIQLTPAYTEGDRLQDHSVIPRERTAVPVEWDDFRDQLERITAMLAPTEAGGTSTLGSFINTAADNLRGRGTDIRGAVIEMSQAIAALGDHSDDIFSTVRNLSLLTSALQGSTDVMALLNQNLAAVTGRLAENDGAVGAAIADLGAVIGEVTTFVADNRETVGVTSDKLAAVSTTLAESLDDIKQTLHIAPTAAQNFVNIYQPAQGTLTGALAVGNFADPITFICGAVQAASRLGGEQSAKLCVQYLAPIVKNRQYNFPPLGLNPFVGASARPNEITYSEDWMRPDHIPPPVDPTPAGLPDLMLPGGGS
ncbi:MCE family protein [Mycolicibacterium alvei]|uniref:Mce family protein Mce3D n=1 Tax=Mycolicibacterium alvei TaxID=67081 RepID=A0A6N4UQT6_9MYCO|nr:MCE family protein [Mycolicibacterium alvei]MCV7002151.1 MCE family protein [Mycolicibacterium alvei]BBX26233.1 Mce family protein Mce3D [Mycolicibacterium alvei]